MHFSNATGNRNVNARAFNDNTNWRFCFLFPANRIYILTMRTTTDRFCMYANFAINFWVHFVCSQVWSGNVSFFRQLSKLRPFNRIHKSNFGNEYRHIAQCTHNVHHTRVSRNAGIFQSRIIGADFGQAVSERKAFGPLWWRKSQNYEISWFYFFRTFLRGDFNDHLPRKISWQMAICYSENWFITLNFTKKKQ